ncbi:MAG TPA: hypothetical protein VGQ80_15525, partial [Acidimicrobiia bacterium]|nr:hypothetical protein [Acidimicrobiia bacterium]
MKGVMGWIRNQWDRVGAWVCVVAGALMVVFAWVGASKTPYTVEQIPYIISGGIGGLFLLGLGAMLWVSADLRDQWRTMEQIRTGQAGRAAEGDGDTIVLPDAGDAGDAGGIGGIGGTGGTGGTGETGENGVIRSRPASRS